MCARLAEAGGAGPALSAAGVELLAAEEGGVFRGGGGDLEEVLIAARLGCDYTLANALTEFSLGCFSERCRNG